MPSATDVPPHMGHPPDLSQKLPRLVPRRRPAQERKTSNPPPPTPTLAPASDLTSHTYATPTRRILSERDHGLFTASPTHDLVVSFVFHLSDSVQDKTITQVANSEAASDPSIKALLTVLDEAQGLLEQCPPLDTGSRFGNPAFRTYLDKLKEQLSKWHRDILGVKEDAAISEVSVYLSESFGNRERIDYGSGHELNFLLWLLCLRQFHLVSDEVFPALTLIVFPRYLSLMRQIQSTYYLEPAGSHGVWGLDDYQFLPFLFGAAQLHNHKHLRPLSIHNETIVEECRKDFLYLDQIHWVNATKTVQGLRWHSPMLDDISAAKSWAKVEGGMRRMFLGEVLGKLPVAQHFLFGSILPAAQGMGAGGPVEEEGHEGHGHDGGASWGDCCGIKVPSAVGARMESGKGIGEGTGLRRIPFD